MTVDNLRVPPLRCVCEKPGPLEIQRRPARRIIVRERSYVGKAWARAEVGLIPLARSSILFCNILPFRGEPSSSIFDIAFPENGAAYRKASFHVCDSVSRRESARTCSRQHFRGSPLGSRTEATDALRRIPFHLHADSGVFPKVNRELITLPIVPPPLLALLIIELPFHLPSDSLGGSMQHGVYSPSDTL